MSLRRSYSFIAPFYDLALSGAFHAARRASLAALPGEPSRVLIDGVGTGLDLVHLPLTHRYTALDLTPAMLRRATRRTRRLEIAFVEGDSQRLPFGDAVFDAAILHLIVAVVPDPRAALAEAARVVRSGGTLLVLDKFLRRGTRAPVRRALTPLAGRLATRLDVVFEDLLDGVPGLEVMSDAPVAAGGWFRRIVLRRTG